MQRYESYKASGVERLGSIPAHWEIKKIKHIHAVNPCGNYSKPDELVTFLPMEAMNNDGTFDVHRSGPRESYGASLTEFRVGDVLLAKITPCFENGKGAFISQLPTPKGIGSTEFHVFRSSTRINPKFTYYLLHNEEFRKFSVPFMEGTAGQKRVTTPFVKNLYIPLPPKEEQDRIAKFLDQKTAEIDAAIAKKMRLIKLLQEQKNILTTQAVTCGLNSSVPMQVSEINGIKMIPAHWSFVANRRIFREKAKKYCGEDLPPLSLSQKDGLIPTDDMKERSLKTSSFEHFRVCLKDDLVLNRFKAHLGVFFAAKLSGVIIFHYGIYTPKSGVSSKYYELLFHTNQFCEIYAGASNGMTVGLQNLSNQNFYDVKSILPPYGEQLEIVAYAESIEQKYNRLICSIKEEINALLEMKKVIVSDAVLGRLKVPSLGKTKG